MSSAFGIPIVGIRISGASRRTSRIGLWSHSSGSGPAARDPTSTGKSVDVMIANIEETLGSLAAVAGAVLSILSYRHARSQRRTVVEAESLWHPRGLPVFPVRVRNLGVETLAVTEAEILRPKGSKIGLDPQGLFGLTPTFPSPEKDRLKFNLVAFPASRAMGGSLPSTVNEAVVPLYFEPPRTWRGGWVKVRIAVSSMASDAKPRRFKVSRYLGERSGTLTKAARRPCAEDPST